MVGKTKEENIFILSVSALLQDESQQEEMYTTKSNVKKAEIERDDDYMRMHLQNK
jgi:hypothetical protein